MKNINLYDMILELRKSPACILFSIIGFLDLITFIFIFLFLFSTDKTFILYILSMCYLSLRIPGFPYYISILLMIFIIEKIFKFKIKNIFIINNKIYQTIWLSGFIIAIIGSILLPVILIFLKKYGTLL
jgi:hypothetical protein